MKCARTHTSRGCPLLLGALCPCAFALNPSLDISQYAHTAWTIRDGFFTGTSIDRSDAGRLSVVGHRIWPVSFRWRPEGSLESA